MTENEIEQALIQKLGDLKYTLRPDIRDRATLTEGEFQRLQDELITPGHFAFNAEDYLLLMFGKQYGI